MKSKKSEKPERHVRRLLTAYGRLKKNWDRLEATMDSAVGAKTAAATPPATAPNLENADARNIVPRTTHVGRPTSAIPAVAKKPSSSDESSWSSWSESPTTRSGAPRPKDNREKAKDGSVDETHSAVSTIMPSTSSSQPNDPASETPDPSKPPTLFSDFDGDSDADCHVHARTLCQ